jgi:hypothetical protein
MEIIDCGGTLKDSQCGWNSLTYLLGFDARQYLALSMPNLGRTLLRRVFRELYTNDAQFQTAIRNLVPDGPSLLQDKPLKESVVVGVSKQLQKNRLHFEFNDLWGLLLVMTPFFVQHSLTIVYFTSDFEQMGYTGIGQRTHQIALFGGDGHWQALRLAKNPRHQNVTTR